MARRNFPARIRKAAYERAKGRCEECGCDLTGRRWDADHVRPDWGGGPPTLANCRILCAGGKNTCHGKKTGIEATSRAKADRCRRFMETGRSKERKGRPLKGGKFRGWTRFNGEPVRAGR